MQLLNTHPVFLTLPMSPPPARPYPELMHTNRCRLLITNPDMLHVSILTSHGQFQHLLANLKYVALDEVGPWLRSLWSIGGDMRGGEVGKSVCGCKGREQRAGSCRLTSPLAQLPFTLVPLIGHIPLCCLCPFPPSLRATAITVPLAPTPRW